MIRVYRPRHECDNPRAEAIAAMMPDALKSLRTRRLVADICAVTGASVRTAMRAVTILRVRR